MKAGEAQDYESRLITMSRGSQPSHLGSHLVAKYLDCEAVEGPEAAAEELHECEGEGDGRCASGADDLRWIGAYCKQVAAWLARL